MANQLPDYPFPRECALQPPPRLTAARETGPITRVRFWDGQATWLILGHAEARAAFSHPNISADSTYPGFPLLGPGATNPRLRTFTRMDPPEHTRLRRMVSQWFTVKRCDQLRPFTREIMADLLDQYCELDRPADLISNVALPLPSTMIAEILGIPHSDHEFFQTRSRGAVSVDPDEVRESTNELLAYLDDLCRLKEDQPGDDLLSRLARDYWQTGQLAHEDLVTIARQLLSAGHETTANMLGLCILSIVTNDELRADLLADKSTVVSAVEELLRFHTILQFGAPRVAKGDAEINGTLIRDHEPIIVSVLSANRDPHAFGCTADAISIDRDVRHQVGFGFGVHQCLGQNLARMELQEGIVAILDRLPDIRLGVHFADLAFKTDRIVYGLEALPLSW
jgi:cytochrome P450